MGITMGCGRKMVQELTADIETDAFDADSLEELKAEMPNTCNGFAFAYAEANGNVVVKDAMVDGSQEHCFVYDADLDVTIDVTLGQFDDRPIAGAWDGDRHPHLNTPDEVFEWESREAFEAHYGDHPENPFHF